MMNQTVCVSGIIGQCLMLRLIDSDAFEFTLISDVLKNDSEDVCEQFHTEHRTIKNYEFE